MYISICFRNAFACGMIPLSCMHIYIPIKLLGKLYMFFIYKYLLENYFLRVNPRIIELFWGS